MTGMFVGIHAMLAIQTNNPELMISDAEGKSFMNAAQNVMRHYSVETTQKTLDWIAFLGIGVGIYGTRVVAISNRRAVEKTPGERRTQREPAQVAPLHIVPTEG